jgi:GTP-binding protein
MSFSTRADKAAQRSARQPASGADRTKPRPSAAAVRGRTSHKSVSRPGQGPLSVVASAVPSPDLAPAARPAPGAAAAAGTTAVRAVSAEASDISAPDADLTPLAGPVDARTALAWTHTARFFDTAARLDHLPAGELPEIAFVGRSNAGKSTAINRLAQQKRLAFASRTPGRTQHINLFAVGPKDAPDALFADLPGYGYAAVERSAKLRWQEVMSQYLQLRRPLHGVVMMVDARLGFTELDQRLLTLLAPRVVCGEVRLLVLLTKADKLNRREAQAALATAEPLLAAISGEASDIGVTLFSALSRQGLDDVAQSLYGWVRAGLPTGTPGDPATDAPVA